MIIRMYGSYLNMVFENTFMEVFDENKIFGLQSWVTNKGLLKNIKHAV